MPPTFPWHWVAMALAALLAIAGAGVVALALFRDRSRGRPRCPKCWYDMSGVAGLKCPECGREVRHARKLLKTRRRWRRAVVGVLMLLVAGAAAVGEPMLRQGAITGAPTLGYIAALPWMKPGPEMTELRKRVTAGTMWRWQYRLLEWRTLDALEQPGSPKLELVGMLDDMFTGSSQAPEKPYLSWARPTDLDTRRMATTLLPMLKDQDKNVRAGVLSCLAQCRGSARVVIPTFMGLLGTDTDWNPGEVEAAINRLGERRRGERPILVVPGPSAGIQGGAGAALRRASFNAALHAHEGDVAKMVQILVDGLADPYQDNNISCIWGLSHLASDDPAVQDAVMAQWERGADKAVRSSVVKFVGRLPLTPPLPPRVVAILRAALADHEWSVERDALDAVGALGPAGRMFEDGVALSLQDPQVAYRAAATWLKIGGPPEVLPARLVSALPHAQGWIVAETLCALAETSPGSPEVLHAVEPCLEHRDPDYRNAAAYALVRLGSDPIAPTTNLINSAARQGEVFALSARWYLDKLARLGMLHVPTVSDHLEHHATANRHELVRTLAKAGSSAASALPLLRGLRSDPDLRVADEAEHAVKRIEWELGHPHKAARLRRESVPD